MAAQSGQSYSMPAHDRMPRGGTRSLFVSGPITLSLKLRLTTTPLDAAYVPADHTRLTTNFGNLAKDPRVADGDCFPMTETLRGGNYSSYVRDHDVNVVLPRIRVGTASPEEGASFGQLHGLLFRLQFQRHHPSVCSRSR